MKKKILKPFTILLVSLLLIPFAPVRAPGCGGGDDETIRYRFFSPSIIRDQSEASFFVSPGNPGNVAYDYESENMSEWRKYLDTTFSAGGIYELIYKASLEDVQTIKEILNNRSSMQAPPGISEFANEKKMKKLNPVLDYVIFAKQCESQAFSDNAYNGWSQTEPVHDSTVTGQYIRKITIELKGKKPIFLRQRYAFQLLRLYFFSGNYDKGIDFYDSTMQFMHASESINTRALGYQAACYYRLGDYAHANYIYAMLYNSHPENMNSLIWSFHPLEEEDWNATLALAKNDKEKITLWHMLGIYKDPLRAMKNIYSIDPKSDGIDLLLTRAVNTEEQYMLNDIDLDYEGFRIKGNNIQSPYLQDSNNSLPLLTSLIKELRNGWGQSTFSSPYVDLDFDSSLNAMPLFTFVKACADKGNTNDPALWNVATGYLFYLANGPAKNAEIYFNKERNNRSEEIKHEIRLTEILFRLRDLQVITKANEATLMADLSYLSGYKALNHNDDDEYIENADIYYLNALAAKYNRQGDTVLSELCHHGGVFYVSKSNTDEMYEFMSRPEHTPWENLLLGWYFVHKEDVIEWQAINLMYNNDLEGARKKFMEDPQCGGEQLMADPFIIHVKDCHECDFNATQTIKYSKLDFVNKMLEYKSLATTDRKHKADYYYKIANGYYNMTWYGNARILFDGSISADMNYSYYYVPTYSDNFGYIDKIPPAFDYLDCSNAKKYYQRAYDAAPDKEFAAHCCWMLAKCELNEYYNGGNAKNNPFPNADFVCGPHVKELQQKFADTQYYQDVIKDCGYFRTWLDKN